MSDYKREEYEQSEEVRKWLKDNIQTLIAGVAGGLALLYGWQYFQQWQAEQQQAAAAAYHEYVQVSEKRDRQQAEAALKLLQQDFPRSFYTALATMEHAALLKEEDPAQALQTLTALRERTGEAAFDELLELRIARLQWQTGDSDGALSTLAGVRSEAWASLAEEIRGDILVQRGDTDAARTAYRKALEALDPTRAGSRPLLEMKLDNLGGDAAADDAREQNS